MKKIEKQTHNTKKRLEMFSSENEDDNMLPDSLRKKRERSSLSYKNETKTFRKNEYKIKETTVHGRVIYSKGKSWFVQSEISSNTVVRCTVAGTVRSQNSDSTLIAVGDRVGYVCNTDGKETAKIVFVDERKTKLSRRGIGKSSSEQVIVSNTEQLLIVMSAAEPFYNRRLIDRYLIAAEKGELTPIICINKTELMTERFVKDDMKVYQSLGVKVHLVSAKNKKGLRALELSLHGKITVFSGPSGVGKSTIANSLLGVDHQEVGEISERTWKGRHITTGARMFALPKGGFIADTPGLRELGLWDVSRQETQYYFHEFDDYFPDCKYSLCLHRNEPECAVIAALKRGEIDAERYQSYCNIIDSIE
ncbi:MAG: ribosome small subunit-dependent GTPase A [Ignavibacteria bacterium]|nr:ribosome small subunit-dependent GTPase A [Ignavibacteria bacterium]